MLCNARFFIISYKIFNPFFKYSIFEGESPFIFCWEIKYPGEFLY